MPPEEQSAVLDDNQDNLIVEEIVDDNDPDIDPSKEDRGDVVTPPAEEKAPEEKTDEEDKGKEAAEETKEEEQSGKENKMPMSRFNEVNQRMKEAERELAELKAEAAKEKEAEEAAEQEKTFDYRAKEAEYTEALLDGDTNKAVAIRLEVNEAIRGEAEQKAEEKARGAISEDKALAAEQRAKEELNAAADKVTKEYPILDERSKEYNAEAGAEVVDWTIYYVNKGGYSMAEAMEAAAKKVLPTFGVQYGKASPEKDGEAEKRGKNAVERAAKGASQQPPSPAYAGRGERATAASNPSVANMSEEEFDKLPEKEKERLRGD